MQSSLILPSAASPFVRRTSAAAVGLCAALLGCSDERLNMGEGVPVPMEPAALPLTSRCLESPSLEGEISVHNQRELDALEGCERIDGDLYVEAFAGAQLHALHALTAVSGVFNVGHTPDQYADTQPEDAAAQQELQESGWLASLEGLEALESAGSLSLLGFASEDVKPLANLRTLTDGLSIGFATNLKNFDGLQNLTGLQSLSINAALKLESFDGLTLPEYMLSMHLTDVDLRQLKPIGVKYLDGLYVDDTQLHDLAPFASLAYAGHISIVANFQLTSLAGLENLQRLKGLDLDYNRALRDVPDFEQVGGLRSLRITGSPELARFPAFQTMQFVYPSTTPLSPEDFITTRPDVLEIVELGLTELSLPAGWSSAAFVRIEFNANLRHIDFTRQSYIDYLSIRNNAQLESVSIGALGKVNVLDVVDNPRLSMAAFDAVRRLDLTASGNADTP